MIDPATTPHGPHVWSLNSTGATLALAMSWVALSPSLLPRAWWASGLMVGLSSILGYAMGSAVQLWWVWFSRLIGLEVRVRPQVTHVARRAWFALLCAITILSWRANVRRQEELASLVGISSSGWSGQVIGLALGVGLFIVALAIGRALARVARWTNRQVTRVLPSWAAPGATVLVLVVVIALVANGLVIRPLVNELAGAAERANFLPSPDRRAPSEPSRSGSPSSLVSWESLGRQGQAVVADGPRAADIAALTRKDALEPIRVYVGLPADRDLRAAAELVVAELDRTDAWDRSWLLIATSVGNGWVDEYTLASVEYLTGGDVASASLQYTYLPSALAYVLDRESCSRAGTMLWEAIHERWLQLPADDRPRLLLNGESLGSTGSQAPFATVDEVTTQAWGAVWVGTPGFTPLWRSVTDSRRRGTPEIAPVIDNGARVRFTASPPQLDQDLYGGAYVGWQDHRVVYLQNASDPVVWWSPQLLVTEPDWMREKAGTDVDPGLTWYPWVSFWQLALDMPNGPAAPSGHGHQYAHSLAPTWNAVLGHPASPQQVEAIDAAITASLKDR